jgi:hypothetical protein
MFMKSTNKKDYCKLFEEMLHFEDFVRMPDEDSM